MISFDEALAEIALTDPCGPALSGFTPDEWQRALESAAMAADLKTFVKAFWRVGDPNEPFVEGWCVDAIIDHLMAVTDGTIRRLLINVPPGFTKSFLVNVFHPAWEWGPAERPWYRYICAAYNAALTMRDNGRFRRVLLDPAYYALWGQDFVLTAIGSKRIENSRTGFKVATSVGGLGTGERGNRFLIDDANNPKEVESDAVREGTNLWMRVVVPDRLNNMKRDAIICIQQRTHSKDVSGTILDVFGEEYTHLMIPMEYEPERHCVTVLGWEDPRGLDDTGNRLEGFGEDAEGALTGQIVPGSAVDLRRGRLAWPARFPMDVVESLRKKGPYAWCNVGEAPILMADLSLRPIRDIREGDEIVGFTTETGRGSKRRHLTKTRVIAISVSHRPVVRITLSSGEVIRCTPDHKWATIKGLHEGYLYAKPRRGAALARVCPPVMWRPQTDQEAHFAGWLGGFFDGEGSVIHRNPRSNGKAGTLITFTQGDGRNRPLCEKLEKALTLFGFKYGLNEHARTNVNGDTLPHKMRTYYLTGTPRLPIFQRFLQIAQPNKWRDRIIDGALSARFGIGRKREQERIVSIEPDGEDTVYGLTTTIGNYVAWGLASSNSSQYQQSPVPRGGNLIQRRWWLPWENEKFPDFGTVAVSLDTAIKEGEENDWNALTAWGAFANEEDESPRLMLRAAKRMRGSLSELAMVAGQMCKEVGAEVLLIEDKTRGHDCAAEIQRLFADATWTTILVPPAGDKISRVIACQPFWSGDVMTRDDLTGITTWTGGVIYAPNKTWAEEVIEECEQFPRGEWDDYVDTCTQALLWMRVNGVVVRPVEHRAAELEARKLERLKPRKSIYDV
jgi:phage terminase large subunit-like protein